MKSFNAKFETDLIIQLENNIVPQDIGRVPLNLYSSTYAVSEKGKNPRHEAG